MWPATIGLVVLLALVFSFAMWVARLGAKVNEAGRDLVTRGRTNIEATVNPAATGVKQPSTAATTQASVGVQGSGPSAAPASPGQYGATGATGPAERSNNTEIESAAFIGPSR
jgi:hypothetical protein